MPRRELLETAGVVLHVLNRSAKRLRLFEQPSDYRAFLNTLTQAKTVVPIEVMTYCVMPNHFHLVVRPRENGQLPRFMRWLQLTHSKRWRGFRGTHGEGAVYQGRYRAIPVQNDEHFFVLCRYVEGNALRAGLVARAEDWPWSGLFARLKKCDQVPLDPWPIPQPEDWLRLVNQHATARDVARLRISVQRNVPFGTPAWIREFPEMLGKTGRALKKIPGEFLPLD